MKVSILFSTQFGTTKILRVYREDLEEDLKKKVMFLNACWGRGGPHYDTLQLEVENEVTDLPYNIGCVVK